MGAINPRPGGTGGGGSVTAADITDSTATGRGVLTGTAAQGRSALGLEEIPLADAGAWTLDTGVVVAASTMTATITSALAARIIGACPHGRRLVGTELVARLAYTGALASPTHAWAEVGLNLDVSRNGVHVQLRGDGELMASYINTGSWTNTSTVTADPAGTWVRLAFPTRERMEVSYSTAVARPTSEDGWTWLGALTISLSPFYGTIRAGVASDAPVDAVATVTGLTLRGWPQ